MFFRPTRFPSRRPLPTLLCIGALLLWASAREARAQRQSFEGSAERAQAKAAQDRMLDLNGDGVVDDQEREMAFQYVRQQNAINEYGEVNQEKQRELKASRKRLQAEARRREREEAVAEKLRARKARGAKLSDAEEAQLRAADQAAEARRRERERLAREQQTKASVNPASQMLHKPILDATH